MNPQYQQEEIYLTPPSTPPRHSTSSSTDEYMDTQGCGNVVDCYLDVKVENLKIQVTSRILFQNNTDSDLEDAIFYYKVATGGIVNGLDCFVEMGDSKPVSRRTNIHSHLEKRLVKNAVQDGPYFSCNVGTIESHQDIVIFLRYEHKALFDNGAAIIHLPLPGRLGERMITRQGTSMMEWNGSHLLSFIAMNLHMSMPGQIHKISSNTHSTQSTIHGNQATVEIENEVLLGQDTVVLAVEATNLADMVSRQSSLGRHSSQESIHSGSTMDSASCKTPSDVEWRDEKLHETYDHGYIFEQYLYEPQVMELCDSDLILDTMVEDLNNSIVQKDFSKSKPQHKHRSSNTFPYNNKKPMLLNHPPTIPHRKQSLGYSKPHDSDVAQTWYEEDSEIEDEEPELYDISAPVALYSSEAELDSDEEEDDDDEWDGHVADGDVQDIFVSIPPSEIFIGTALAVSPGRPRLVTISPKLEYFGSTSYDIAERTSRRISRHMRTATFGEDIHDQELDDILTSLTSQVKRSSNAFLTLSEEFADTIKVDLDALISHPGAQSRRLSGTSRCFREGIWANILALHFLQFVLDFEGLASNDAILRTRFDRLIDSLENPLLQQEKQITGSMSLIELSEMARDVFPIKDDAAFRKSLDMNASRLGILTPPISPARSETGSF